MRTHASFRAHVPRPDDDRAPGEPLADLLAEGLAGAGYRVSGRDESEYSHYFFVRHGWLACFVEIGYVGDGEREWLLTCSRGPLARLFGDAGARMHGRLLEVIHDRLSGDDRVSGLRWYTREQWDQDGQDGAPSPAG